MSVVKAHKEEISKIWVNVDKDGKTIEKSVDFETGTMLYKEPFKLHEGHYWVGDELKVTEKDDKGKYKVPEAKVKYLFFRSKTDHWNNLIQGSFERATEDSKAHVVCEYPAKIVLNQERYCELMGEKGLGLNTMYDDTIENEQCVYTTLTKYALMGTENAIRSFTGCGEKPSKLHSSGIDDGTAQKNVYTTLTTNKKKGTYRIAGIRVTVTGSSSVATAYKNAANIRTLAGLYSFNAKFVHAMIAEKTELTLTPPHYTVADLMKKMGHDHIELLKMDIEGAEITVLPQFLKSNSVCQDNAIAGLDNVGGGDYAIPNDEEGTVKGWNGDESLLPVICSIASISDCKSSNVCAHRPDQHCVDVQEYQDETKKYAKCECYMSYREGEVIDVPTPVQAAGADDSLSSTSNAPTSPFYEGAKSALKDRST